MKNKFVYALRLLMELDKERSKFTKWDENKMQEMIDVLVKEKIYPSKPTPAMKQHGYTILDMVKSWGVNWCIFDGMDECPNCGADLRDEKNGPPFKREIGIYSMEEDRTVDKICPDCHKSINDGKQYDKTMFKSEEL